MLIQYQYKIIQYSSSNSQRNKLKLGIKNGTKVTLNLSWNVIGNSNDENNFSHKLLLTNTQLSRFCKALANGSSANIKKSKTQLSRIGQLERFLGWLLGPLLKTGLPVMKNVLKPLVKSVLIPLGLTAAASVADVFKRMFLDQHDHTDILKWRNQWYHENN